MKNSLACCICCQNWMFSYSLFTSHLWDFLNKNHSLSMLLTKENNLFVVIGPFLLSFTLEMISPNLYKCYEWRDHIHIRSMLYNI